MGGTESSLSGYNQANSDEQYFQPPTQFRANLRNPPFSAIWSIIPTNSICPASRVEHFTAYLPDETAVFGYGIDRAGNLLSDVWSLDMKTASWSQVRIDSNQVSPRQGAKAVTVGRQIFIFGGQCQSTYYSDLHIIDIDSLQVSRPNTSGLGPCGRVGHVMSYCNGQILIWGGSNGTIINDLWIFDIQTQVWTNSFPDINGRSEACFIGTDRVFITAASQSDNVLIYDFNTHEMEEVDVKGNPPPFNLRGASAVRVDRYLILIGGRFDKQPFSLIRAYDTEMKWWFILNILPDGETTTLSDGTIDQNGFFLVPRIAGPSAIYREKTREVCILMGSPHVDPPPVYVLHMGDALSYLHLSNDMREMLKNVL